MQRTRVEVWAWCVASLGAIACGAKVNTSTPREPAAAPKVASLPTAAPAASVVDNPKDPPRVDLQSVLCGTNANCVVKTAYTFDASADGSKPVIALVPLEALPDSNAAAVQCQAHEVWMVRLAADGAVLDRQLVGGGCAEDTPYGGACDGVPLMRITPPVDSAATSVTIGWQAPGYGCGGWTRADGDVEVSVATFGALRRREYFGRAAHPDDSHTKTWDFTQRTFQSEWQTANNDTCPPRTRASAGVPQLELPSAFVDGAWRGASLGDCATTLSSSYGFALPGTRKSKATLRVVLSRSDVLFAEVTDSRPLPPTASLQVCFAEMNAQMYDYCRMPFKPECVRVAPGAAGRSGDVEMEGVVGEGGVARFRVELPPDNHALSVAYVDGRGGTLATTANRKGDATSLGKVYKLGPALASCTLEAQQLRFVPAPRKPERALLDAEDLQ